MATGSRNRQQNERKGKQGEWVGDECTYRPSEQPTVSAKRITHTARIYYQNNIIQFILFGVVRDSAETEADIVRRARVVVPPPLPYSAHRKIVVFSTGPAII